MCGCPNWIFFLLRELHFFIKVHKSDFINYTLNLWGYENSFPIECTFLKIYSLTRVIMTGYNIIFYIVENRG